MVFLLHVIADFGFQPRRLAQNKYRNLKLIVVHVLMYTAVVGFAVGYDPLLLLAIAVPHGIIDYFGLGGRWLVAQGAPRDPAEWNEWDRIVYVVLDQTLHVLCLLPVAALPLS